MKKITSKNKIFKKKKNLKTKSLEKPSKKNLEKKPLQNTKKNFGDKLVVKKIWKKKKKLCEKRTKPNKYKKAVRK